MNRPLTSISRPEILREVVGEREQTMNQQLTSISRRRFVSALGFVLTAAGLRPLLAADGRKLTWQRDAKTRLFTGVSADGAPLITQESGSLLTASARVAGATGPGPLRLAVEHRLRDSGAGQGEDSLEATLTVRNTSDRPQRVEMEFATAARPSPGIERTAASMCRSRPPAGSWRQAVRRAGREELPQGLQPCSSAPTTSRPTISNRWRAIPAERETRALLLAPVVDVFDPQRPWRIALFTPSDQPMRFSHSGGLGARAGRSSMAAGGTLEQRCWLMIHQGDAAVAWRAFHRFGHREEFAVPELGARVQGPLLRFPLLGAGRERPARRRLRERSAALSRVSRRPGDAARILPGHRRFHPSRPQDLAGHAR